MTCGTCFSYLTDEDENGKVTYFHHDRSKPSGFCAMRELFYTVKKDYKSCESYCFDGGEK